MLKLDNAENNTEIQKVQTSLSKFCQAENLCHPNKFCENIKTKPKQQQNILFNKISIIIVTRLKGFVCLCVSQQNKTQTGICSKESKVLFSGDGLRPELTLKTWLLDDSPDRVIYVKMINHGD